VGQDVNLTTAAIRAHYGLAPSDEPVIRLPHHARASLASLYHKLGYRKGLELGVWNGEHAELLCQYNPEMEWICVDAWEYFAVKANHPMPSAFVKVRREAHVRLAQYRATILPLFGAEAAALVPDRSLDCIFIDASHGLNDVLLDLKTWAPKVKVGGIISGHDYETTALGWPAENGVKEAVHTYLDAHGIQPLYLLMGTARDRWKSYFWVSV
jgi:hypothetical protein